MTGERQAQKYREAYVRSIFSQAVGWFDEMGSQKIAACAADLPGKVQGKCIGTSNRPVAVTF